MESNSSYSDFIIHSVVAITVTASLGIRQAEQLPWPEKAATNEPSEPDLRHATPQLHSRLYVWQEGRSGLAFWRAALRPLDIPVST
jgi:hypothetical protein